jgi:transcriptional antiterminator NusG
MNEAENKVASAEENSSDESDKVVEAAAVAEDAESQEASSAEVVTPELEAESTTVEIIEQAEPAPADDVDVVEEEEDDEDEEDGVLPTLDPERAKHPWYVVHTYSGYELRVKLGLEERIKAANLTQKFGHIVVPQEKVVELVKGEKKTSTRKFFPGYILVQCDLDEEAWHLVKDTPKVTGFIGDSVHPTPLSQEEVAGLIEQMEGRAQRARPKIEFEQGDAIKVIDGPFAEFNGTVDEVKPDKGKLRVLISIFGRNTPVELDFIQVEKV